MVNLGRSLARHAEARNNSSNYLGCQIRVRLWRLACRRVHDGFLLREEDHDRQRLSVELDFDSNVMQNHISKSTMSHFLLDFSSTSSFSKSTKTPENNKFQNLILS